MNNTQIRHDPIVAEIHATREQSANQYHDDLLEYSKTAELHCRALGFRFVESPRRQPVQEVPIEAETVAE